MLLGYLMGVYKNISCWNGMTTSVLGDGLPDPGHAGSGRCGGMWSLQASFMSCAHRVSWHSSYILSSPVLIKLDFCILL